MIDTGAMPALSLVRRVALHHRRSNLTLNDFAGALDVVQPAVVAECDGAGFVDTVAADPVVGAGGAAGGPALGRAA